MKRYLVVLFILLAGCFTSGKPSISYMSREEPALGTFISITIEKSPNCEKILEGAFSFIRELEKRFSVYIPDSEISRLNSEKKIDASKDLVYLIRKSIEISKITGGAFDITVLPLINLYREAEKKGMPPSDEEIRKILKYTGYEKIKIKDNIIQIPEKTEIDTGGIAKGYIVDSTAEFLKKNGIKNGLVNAGGDIYCFGKNPQGEKWKIGIRGPFNKEKTIRTLYLSNCGIATSGDYERYLKIKGKKYGHIINPLTGKTVQNFPVSVTVIAPDTTTADAFATAFFVLGVEKSINLVNKIEGIALFIIDGDGKFYESENFSKFTRP
ncbi:MAG: FAD:protein FMN transferase [Candidatus Omnitrophica bacterium]|nr:FAD:protein FMN transferase [Candidatus Omnitrophota bacterium]